MICLFYNWGKPGLKSLYFNRLMQNLNIVTLTEMTSKDIKQEGLRHQWLPALYREGLNTWTEPKEEATLEKHDHSPKWTNATVQSSRKINTKKKIIDYIRIYIFSIFAVNVTQRQNLFSCDKNEQFLNKADWRETKKRRQWVRWWRGLTTSLAIDYKTTM